MHEPAYRFAKDAGHEALECRGGVAVPDPHYMTEIRPSHCGKGIFPNVAFPNVYLLKRIC